MNPVAQEILKAANEIVPFAGRSNGGGMGSATVVVELGHETLKRLDRLLAVLEHGVSEGESHQVKGLTQPLTLTSDDTPSGLPQIGASPYLDAEAAAEYLGINVKSLYGVVERRHLVPLRGPRRSYRFTREMLDEYLRSHR
jgi:excisionase family DNA binding protein